MTAPEEIPLPPEPFYGEGDVAALPPEPDGLWLGDLLQERVVEYDEPLTVGATTGWIEIDDAINGGRGLLNGQFVLVAGRPGTGKSVLVVDWARRLAVSGETTLLMSLEMSRAEIGDRLLSAASGVRHSLVAGHVLDDWQKHEIAKAADAMHYVPLRVTDTPTVTLGSLRKELVRAADNGNPYGAVVVDYLGLMTTQDPKLPRQEQVSIISRGLKLMAKEFEVKLIAAAQLNRGPEQRPDKRPQLSDLRESGSLEQDCDIAVLLYRPDPENTNRLEAIIAKNRNGPAHMAVPMAFNAHVMRIDNAYVGM